MDNKLTENIKQEIGKTLEIMKTNRDNPNAYRTLADTLETNMKMVYSHSNDYEQEEIDKQTQVDEKENGIDLMQSQGMETPKMISELKNLELELFLIKERNETISKINTEAKYLLEHKSKLLNKGNYKEYHKLTNAFEKLNNILRRYQ